MKTSPFIVILTMFIALLAGIASVIALNSGTVKIPWNYITVRGEEVVIFGNGIYKYDSLFNALGFIAQDFVILFFVIPILIYSVALYWKKEGGANSLLFSILGFLVYAFVSICFGAVLNRLFLLYILILSSSLVTFALLFKEIQFSHWDVKNFPRKNLAVFLIMSGCITLLIWISPLLEAFFTDSSPAILLHYTTLVTHALDLSIIVPASISSGLLVLRRNSLGYKMALPLLGIIIFLVPVIILTTYFQMKNGIILSVKEVAGPIAGFLILGGFGLYFLFKIYTQLRFSFSSPNFAR